jgi:hypothetical protein
MVFCTFFRCIMQRIGVCACYFVLVKPKECLRIFYLTSICWLPDMQYPSSVAVLSADCYFFLVKPKELSQYILFDIYPLAP